MSRWGAQATSAEEEPRGDAALGGRRACRWRRLLTPVESDCHQPEFTPDGKQLYFTAALHAGEDSDLRLMIHSVSITGGEPRLVAGGARSARAWSQPRFSRDGATLFLLTEQLGDDGVDIVGHALSVAALTADAEPGAEPAC